MDNETEAKKVINLSVDAEGNITRGLTGFSDTITNSFTSLLDRLQAIAERVTFTVPNIT